LNQPLENNEIMKWTALILSVAAMAAAASAQTTAKPATTSTATASTTTKTGTTASKTTTASSADWWLKLSPKIPKVRGIVKTDFALRYEDVKIGTGAEAEPNKMYHVNYTGYLAATGEKFDSNADRKAPVMGKDGKPQMGPDGKPVMGEAQPLTFPQGYGRLIPGFDQGFTGMKIGGKRRLFIPWQLAYGTRDIPGHPPDHPGIPPKSDLIFDIELVDVTDMPKPPQRPQMPPPHPGTAPTPGKPGAPGAAPAAPGSAPAPGAAPTTPGAAPTAGTAPTAGAAPAAAPATAAPSTTTAPATTPAPTQPPPTPK
jgi:peptidylprolyl isomerase